MGERAAGAGQGGLSEWQAALAVVGVGGVGGGAAPATAKAAPHPLPCGQCRHQGFACGRASGPAGEVRGGAGSSASATSLAAACPPFSHAAPPRTWAHGVVKDVSHDGGGLWRRLLLHCVLGQGAAAHHSSAGLGRPGQVLRGAGNRRLGGVGLPLAVQLARYLLHDVQRALDVLLVEGALGPVHLPLLGLVGRCARRPDDHGGASAVPGGRNRAPAGGGPGAVRQNGRPAGCRCGLLHCRGLSHCGW